MKKGKNIHESLRTIIDEANKYEFTRAGPIIANPEMILNREQETNSSLDPSEVVGREHDASEIVKLSLNVDNQQLSVIPIVGMASLGKTTLAKQVYNNELV